MAWLVRITFKGGEMEHIKGAWWYVLDFVEATIEEPVLAVFIAPVLCLGLCVFAILYIIVEALARAIF